MVTMRHTCTAALAVGVLLTGCSGGGATESDLHTPAATPTVSTPVDAPSTTQSNDHFDSAVEFTSLVHVGKYVRAGSMVDANSPAERYLTHQMASAKAYQIDGQEVSRDEDDRTINGDEATENVQIRWADGSKYTWKVFRFD